MTDDNKHAAPPPLPEQTTSQGREFSHKTPNGLGLVFAAISMAVGGRGGISAGLLVFLAYVTGAVLGYAIEALRIGRTAKNVLASVLGGLIAGGFVVNKAISQIRQLQTRSDSGQSTSHAPATDRQSAADQVLQAFPSMSAQAKRLFRQKVQFMSEDETMAFLWQLMAEGETLFSDADRSEMTAIYWKAVGSLTPDEQMLVQKTDLKLSRGRCYSASDQQRLSALVQKGFGDLPENDNARYLELRGKAIELALLQSAAASRQPRSTYHPAHSNVTATTPEQRHQRIQDLTARAISLLPEKDRARFLELQLTPAGQLTKAQYAERVRYSERIMSLLSKDERREVMELAAERLRDQ
jgi:hypothetical protein